MKAALLKALRQPFVVEDVPEPGLAPDEALVETFTCGICRTDLHIQDGLAYVPKLPHIPGHEPAGVVVDVGRSVSEVQVGQRVVPNLFVYSADCRYTHAGQHAQATHLEGIIGVTLPGGFAEYFKAPARNLLPLPDAVPFDIGGLTSCAVITAVHAFHKARLERGDTAVVLGAGGIGLILVQLLKANGVRTVALDRSSPNVELAQRLGADLALSSDTECVIERVHAFAGDRDAIACVFELVGTASTMRTAADLVMRGGRIVVIGEEAEFPAIDTIRIAQRELEIIGSRNGGMQDALDALDLMASGVVHPPIAGRFPLDAINEAMAFVRSGLALGRVILTIKEP
jgi:propanol-preferring alcohol dehydrogenase